MKKDRWMKIIVSYDKNGKASERTEPMTEDEIKQVLNFDTFTFSSRKVINGWEIFGELPDGHWMCRNLKGNFIMKFNLN